MPVLLCIQLLQNFRFFIFNVLLNHELKASEFLVIQGFKAKLAKRKEKNRLVRELLVGRHSLPRLTT